jgi:hypothetical protein
MSQVGEEGVGMTSHDDVSPPSADRQSFHSERHPISRRWAVFEDDGVSGWLYLTAPDEERPVADCWVYNRIPAPTAEMARGYAESGSPPPACVDYVGPEALYTGADRPQVQLRWAEDGESVAVLIDQVALGAIIAGGGSGGGFSRHLTRPGPWGQPWNERAVFSTFGLPL